MMDEMTVAVTVLLMVPSRAVELVLNSADNSGFQSVIFLVVGRVEQQAEL